MRTSDIVILIVLAFALGIAFQKLWNWGEEPARVNLHYVEG